MSKVWLVALLTLDDFLLYVALVSAMGLNLFTGSKAYDVVCRQFCEYPDAFIKNDIH